MATGTIRSGLRFGRLVVSHEDSPYFWRGRFARRRWFCDCECGGSATVREDRLKANTTLSCGCLRDDASVCRRWRAGGGRGYAAFLEDLGKRPSPDHRLVRLNEQRGFSPANCAWEHSPPRRGTPRHFIPYRGRMVSLSAAAAATGIDYRRLCKRLERGWSPAEALRP
jgi:hypothetical protein